jgi:hypothetical protein
MSRDDSHLKTSVRNQKLVKEKKSFAGGRLQRSPLEPADNLSKPTPLKSMSRPSDVKSLRAELATFFSSPTTTGI